MYLFIYYLISGSRQNEVRKDLLRLATVNVGSLSRRSGEVVNVFETRRVDIGCLQEVRYNGQGTRVYEGEEMFWWSGSDERKNGVEIIVKEDLVEEVIKVKD